MHTILQGLRDLEGVHGTFVSDSAGQLLSYNAESIYDASLLQQVSKAVANAIDSVKLLEDDWDTITAQFSEGRLLIRSIPPSGRTKGPPLTLSLVADTRLNPSFATVAIRVAIGKIKTLLESNGGNLPASALTNNAGMVPPMQSSAAGSPMAASHPMTGSAHVAMGVPTAVAPAQTFSSVSTPEVAGSGLSWSGLGTSSQMSASGVAVADAASSTALSACTKCLAKAVGPMAKVFVKEAVRKVTPNQPFAKGMLPALIAELEKGIEDGDDAKEFRKSAMKLV
jgi:hypothetical protein